VLEDDEDDNVRNRSPEFLLRTEASGLGRVWSPGAQTNMRLCPGGAQRDGEFSSIDEEARGGRGSLEN
jgi:hypothetical protein